MRAKRAIAEVPLKEPTYDIAQVPRYVRRLCFTRRTLATRKESGAKEEKKEDR